MVYEDSGGGGGGRKRVNQLFRADFFGERALLSDEPRWVQGPRRCRCRQRPVQRLPLPAPLPLAGWGG